MKKHTVIAAFMLFIAIPLYAQNGTPPPEAIKAANEEFIPFLTRAVSEDTKTILGFDAADDLYKAVLGRPFKLYGLSANAIRIYNGISPLDSILTETNMWYFPIIIDDIIKMVLYVGEKDGVWSRAGLGSAPLAPHLQDISKLWPVENGFTPRLIKQINIGGYLYNIPQAGAPNLTEIKSNLSRAGLAKKSAAFKSLNETMQDLHKRIFQ